MPYGKEPTRLLRALLQLLVRALVFSAAPATCEAEELSGETAMQSLRHPCHCHAPPHRTDHSGLAWLHARSASRAALRVSRAWSVRASSYRALQRNLHAFVNQVVFQMSCSLIQTARP